MEILNSNDNVLLNKIFTAVNVKFFMEIFYFDFNFTVGKRLQKVATSRNNCKIQI